MAEKIKKGIFITFEGPEGSGKSTHSAKLAFELESDGYEVLHTAEPGDTPLGGRIRDILLEKDDVDLCPLAELLLFEADRAQHVEEVIKNALNDGRIVICDRFNAATMAYQGYGLGVDKNLIRSVDEAATGGLKPDLTILLDLDVDTGLSRANAFRRADRMEKRDNVFHRKVRRGYLEMAAGSGGNMKVIKVMDGIAETYASVRKEVYAFIEGH